MELVMLVIRDRRWELARCNTLQMCMTDASADALAIGCWSPCQLNKAVIANNGTHPRYHQASITRYLLQLTCATPSVTPTATIAETCKYKANSGLLVKQQCRTSIWQDACGLLV